MTLLNFKTTSLILASFVGLAGCTTQPISESSREPSNIGGVNYNRGSYECQDNQGKGLKSAFTFGAKAATFVIKDESMTLTCTPANKASLEIVAMFRKSYVNVADICQGQSKKGTVYVGTSNSMGAVQMTAFLLKPGAETSKATLNCDAAKASDDGW